MSATSASEYPVTVSATSASNYQVTVSTTSASEYQVTVSATTASEYPVTVSATSASQYHVTVSATSASEYDVTVPTTGANGVIIDGATCFRYTTNSVIKHPISFPSNSVCPLLSMMTMTSSIGKCIQYKCIAFFPKKSLYNHL